MKLKPCPECGCEDITIDSSSSARQSWVECSECDYKLQAAVPVQDRITAAHWKAQYECQLLIIESMQARERRAPNRAPSTDSAAISRAGRVLADRNADACGVDREDNWKVYGQDFIEDALAALIAARGAA